MRTRDKKLRGPAETCRPKNVPTSLWPPTGFEPGFYHFQQLHLTRCAIGWLPDSPRFPLQLIPHLSPPPPSPLLPLIPSRHTIFHLSHPFSLLLQHVLQHHHLCKPIRTFLCRFLNLTWLLTRSQPIFSIFIAIFNSLFEKLFHAHFFYPTFSSHTSTTRSMCSPTPISPYHNCHRSHTE